ncbi:hypothetical protein BJ944DRAFT_253211 [Cunninghamella echinulata]|nr:hypothetical protein BJ944DRAFT_253211 [Cunninghamella echinulata]
MALNINSERIKCPYCNVYIVSSEAVRLHIDVWHTRSNEYLVEKKGMLDNIPQLTINNNSSNNIIKYNNINNNNNNDHDNYSDNENDNSNKSQDVQIWPSNLESFDQRVLQYRQRQFDSRIQSINKLKSTFLSNTSPKILPVSSKSILQPHKYINNKDDNQKEYALTTTATTINAMVAGRKRKKMDCDDILQRQPAQEQLNESRDYAFHSLSSISPPTMLLPRISKKTNLSLDDTTMILENDYTNKNEVDNNGEQSIGINNEKDDEKLQQQRLHINQSLKDSFATFDSDFNILNYTPLTKKPIQLKTVDDVIAAAYSKGSDKLCANFIYKSLLSNVSIDDSDNTNEQKELLLDYLNKVMAEKEFKLSYEYKNFNEIRQLFKLDLNEIVIKKRKECHNILTRLCRQIMKLNSAEKENLHLKQKIESVKKQIAAFPFYYHYLSPLTSFPLTKYGTKPYDQLYTQQISSYSLKLMQYPSSSFSFIEGE